MSDPNSQAESPALPSTLTLADFDAAGFTALVARHHDDDCHALNKVFWAAREGFNDGPRRALELAAGVCSMCLVPEEPTVVYRPMVEWHDGGTSMAPAHLSPAAIELLAHLAVDVPNTALSARMADLVWLKEKRRGAQFAQLAISGYRRRPIARDTWLREGRVSWHRALQLAV